MERSILHCDCNSFFASVELLSRPDLKNVPVAVGGSEANRHGIILAKNEAAKKYNIQTAETVQSALRKCPQLTLLPPHHALYSKYSKLVNAIYARYTDKVEPFGIDESWLDITHTCHLFAPNAEALAHRIREEVKAQTGLTISVGVSFNKVFAKLGSDYKKPDAVTCIPREKVKEIVWPLPVGALLYAGKAAQRTLGDVGIFTIGQLAAASPENISALLGKLGAELSRYARGLDDAPVLSADERPAIKSVGNGLTFRRNLIGEADCTAGVYSLADEVAGRLRKHGLYANGVQVSIKDPQLKPLQRQLQLPTPTHLARDIGSAAMQLLRSNWNLAVPIRMLTVTAINLTDDCKQQLSLFEDRVVPGDKREQLEKSMDTIRAKYGRTAIGAAHALHNDIGIDDVENNDAD